MDFSLHGIKAYVSNKGASLKEYLKSSEFRSNLLFILFLVLIRAFVLGNYSVPTGSMRPTILEGDKFFSNKLAYSLTIPFTKHHPLRWGIPERGDIIAFLFPGNEKIDYTKRVIGLPGDHILLDGHDLYINGELVEKSLIKEDDSAFYYNENFFGVEHVIIHSKFSSSREYETVVPDAHLFVMGDNRDNSSDSRDWGFLPLENVTGKLVLRWLSTVPGKPWKIRFGRIGLIE